MLCKDCKYVKSREWDNRMHSGTKYKCRRYPQEVIVYHSYWCGEFIPKGS